MSRKRTSEGDCPVPKKNVVPPVLSSTNRPQPSRFVSQSYLRQPYDTRPKELLQKEMSSMVAPRTSSVKASDQPVKSEKPSESAESTLSSSKPNVPEGSSAQPPDPSPSVHPSPDCRQRSSNIQETPTEFQTLDFQTASHVPIKLLTSKINAARSLLRDVDITDQEEAENINATPQRIQDVPNSLEQDLDIDWASVGKSMEDKVNETA